MQTHEIDPRWFLSLGRRDRRRIADEVEDELADQSAAVSARIDDLLGC